MSRKHRWIGDQCNKCGLLRNIRKRIINDKLGRRKVEQYYDYYDGYNLTQKRPDCKLKKIEK